MDHIAKSTDDEENIIVPENNASNIAVRRFIPKSLITIEPAVFLIFVSYSWSSTILQNQIIFQTCSVQFNYNISDCLLLGTPDAPNEIETNVQRYASNILIARQLIETVLPGILSLFIGPWSDRFGRKPVILSTFIGYFCIYLMLTVIAYTSTQVAVNPWWYFLAFLPIAFTGGFCALLTGIFCYVADVASPANRAMRMSLMECALFVGILVGSMASSYVYKFTTTYVMFGITTITTLIATLYVMFFVQESIHNGEAERRIGKMAKFGALFDFSLVADILETFFKRREHFERAIIWLTMLSLTCSIFVMEGSGTVFYMFVREKFEWTIQQFTLYESSSIAMQVIGNVFGLYVLVKLVGITESSVAVLAYFCGAVDFIIRAFASSPWHLYLGSLISFLKSVSSPMCRSILSKIVPSEDIGKLFALTTSIESISALGSAPLYGIVYDSTIAYNPGAFNLISAGIFAFCVLLLIIVSILQRHFLPATTITYGPISDE